MTITPPTVLPVTINFPADVFRANSEVQPFSYRSTMTYTEILESIRAWLYNTLVPYLNTNFDDIQGSWIDNVTAISDAVNTALASQKDAVDQELATALAEIVAGANAALNDATVLAALQSAGSTALAYLDARYDGRYAASSVTGRVTAIENLVSVSYAPAPLGNDGSGNPQHDVAAETMANAAAAGNGTVRFQPGHYYLNISTPQSGLQPVLIGSSLGRTYFHPFDPTKPTLKYQGGSGAFSGGNFQNITFDSPVTGTGVAAVELADVCDVTWSRIRIQGNYTDGLRFRITQSAGFCEFNRGEASINVGTNTPIHYMTTNTTESSFHGSGLTDGVINFSGTQAVLIDDKCFVYNAPLSVGFFSGGAGNAFIRNNYAGRIPSFYGTLRSESGQVVWGHNSGSKIYYVGRIIALSGPQTLGKFYVAKKVYYNAGGTTSADLETASEKTVLAAGTTTITTTPLKSGEVALVTVNVVAANYNHQAALLITANPTNSTGGVTILKGSTILNGTAAGDPTWAWSNGALQITNANYSNAYTAYVTVAPFGASTAVDQLAQS